MPDQIPVYRLAGGPDPLAGLSDGDREKLARIEWLRADNQADPHPPFERLTDAEAARAHRRYARRLHEWLGEAL